MGFFQPGLKFHSTLPAWKSLISLFQEFSSRLTKLLFLQGDWALGYHSMEFRHFPDTS